jgi:Sugar-transfer associated ATP-grasp
MNLKRIPYIFALCRKRAREGHLPVYRQLLEIAVLQATRGVGYDMYHYAGMWDRGASWDYKCSFLSYKDYGKKIYQLNARKFHGISQYKPYEKAFFRQFSIPTAPYIGTLNEQWGCTFEGHPLRTPGDLSSCLEKFTGKKICLKLVEGSNGKGFKAYQVVKIDDVLSVSHLSSGNGYSIDDLYQLLMAESTDGWLLEEYIDQHPVLKAFNPSSLNTIRMFLYKNENGEVIPLKSFLKTGKPGALIDKTENGGASVFIDQETGALLHGFNWSPEMRPLDEHPATGVAFKDVKIPFWKEAEDMAVFALQACVDTRFTGVDIAIAEEGPMMVEMNVHPDPDCMPVLKLQTAKIFSS